MKAVILAGGQGSRISEESHLRPKPMIEIGGKPILWHIMKIYSYNGKRVIIVNDLNLSEAYLIYIDTVEQVTINNDSDEYKAYSNLAKFNIKGEIFNTYDTYLKAKYEIEINYNTLDNIKNYFN